MQKKRFPNHIGVKAAIVSLKNNRSPKNAYIVVLGLTGSGKSTAINLLLNRNVAEVGGTQSTSEGIQEYRIPVKIDELGCSNCELRIIDTPGFGDTGGIDFDAKLMAGLDEYLGNHEELNKRLPNIVLLFASFSDNRIEGNSSPFVKMLRVTELFNQILFDTSNPNVITVLTHFMSNPTQERRNPSSKLQIFRELIQDYTTRTEPIRIVVAENRPEDSDLPIINGFYKMPNNEYFPKNLFEGIQDITGIKDPIGEAIIRNVVKISEHTNITKKVFSFDDKRLRREEYYLGVFLNKIFTSGNSELTYLLDTAYREIPQDLKTEYRGSFDYIKKALNTRNIIKLSDIPRTNLEITRLFKNIRHNALIEAVLQKALNLKIPELEQRVVGQCYNMLKHTILLESPFELNENFTGSSIGFKIPAAINCIQIDHVQKNVYSMDKNRYEYLKKRLTGFRFNESLSLPLTGKLLPGYNTEEDFNQTREITILREFRLFQLRLHHRPKLSQKFLDVVERLPPLDKFDNAIERKWKSFFEKFGTHIVQSAYGGGAVEAIFKSDIQSKNYDAYSDSVQKVFNLFEDISLKKTLSSDGVNTSVPFSIRFHGGDIQSGDIGIEKLTTIEITNIMEQFEESLTYKPTILTSEMEVVPISEILRAHSPDGEEKIRKATHAFFSTKLTYLPRRTELTLLEQPEVKKHLNTINETITTLTKLLTADIENEDFIVELIEKQKYQWETNLQSLYDEIMERKRIIGLTCIYSDSKLRGKKVCATNMIGCTEFHIANAEPKSINTHNSCVRIYPATNCNGTHATFISNATTTTSFPMSIPYNTNFSLIRCD